MEWVPVMQEEEESKLIISVASGKGGTGKTTVAVGIAKALEFCQFFDYDVEAPNASFFLKPSIKNIEKVSIKHPYFLKETGADFSRCAEFCHFNAVAFGAAAFSANKINKTDYLTHDYAFITYDLKTHEPEYNVIVPS